MSFESELDDIFLETSHPPVHKLAKFQPKARKKNEKSDRPPSANHTVQDHNGLCEGINYAGSSQESSRVEHPCEVASVRLLSERQIPSTMLSDQGDMVTLPRERSPEPTGNENRDSHDMDFQTEVISSEFDLESLNAILSQRDNATDSDVILPIHGVNFRFDQESLQGAGDSGLADNIFEINPSSSESRVESKFQPRTRPGMQKEGVIPPVSSDSLTVQDGKTSSFFREFEANTTHGRDRIEERSPTEEDDEGLEADFFDDADLIQTYSQPSDINQNVVNREVMGMDSQSPNDSQSMRENNDGMVLKDKTIQHERDPLPISKLQEDTQRRKFSHFTRRRRRVDKVLLETAEEDINPMKLKIKDLIMLAETRERKAAKIAAEAKLPEKQNGVGGEADNRPVKIRLNYHTFMNRQRAERWSKVDTDLFYKAVRQFGTDFAMIQQLFPNRTRHQIKLKYKNEERKHPLQIADAVVHRSKDHSHFELVIERLKAQEEEAKGSADAGTEPAESEIGEENEGEVDEKKQEFELDDWDQPANEQEEQEVLDWTRYDISASEPTYGTDKDGYDDDYF